MNFTNEKVIRHWADSKQTSESMLPLKIVGKRNLTSNGNVLRSYGLIIGITGEGGLKTILDYTAGGLEFYSQTTSHHVGLAKHGGYADFIQVAFPYTVNGTWCGSEYPPIINCTGDPFPDIFSHVLQNAEYSNGGRDDERAWIKFMADHEIAYLTNRIGLSHLFETHVEEFRNLLGMRLT